MINYSDEELLQVVAERAKKYTSNESTSITYNKARQLMGSILYCMQDVEEEESSFQEKKLCSQEEESSFQEEKLCSQEEKLCSQEKESSSQEELNSQQKESNNTTVQIKNNISAKDAFKIGLNKKKEIIKSTEILYQTILHSFFYYKNECYRDTIISGMTGFFKVYDVEFDATNHILTLDYPLIYEVKKLQGIDLIHEYLYRTLLEQRFLGRFDEESIIEILSGYHKNYEELIINICKLVLRNALGCMLIDKSIVSLNIRENDRNEIKRICQNKSLTELKQSFLILLDKLIKDEFESDLILYRYLKQDINDFAYELRHCLEYNCLDKLFLEVRKEVDIKETVFEEGISMEDEALRKLIDEMSNIALIEDKIELLKKNIKSLSDLKEILLECFYKEECEKVFELLSYDEISALQKEIKQKIDFDEELYEWEAMLIKINVTV